MCRINCDVRGPRNRSVHVVTCLEIYTLLRSPHHLKRVLVNTSRWEGSKEPGRRDAVCFCAVAFVQPMNDTPNAEFEAGSARSARTEFQALSSILRRKWAKGGSASERCDRPSQAMCPILALDGVDREDGTSDLQYTVPGSVHGFETELLQGGTNCLSCSVLCSLRSPQ